jgi:hypothetical protein
LYAVGPLTLMATVRDAGSPRPLVSRASGHRRGAQVRREAVAVLSAARASLSACEQPDRIACRLLRDAVRAAAFRRKEKRVVGPGAAVAHRSYHANAIALSHGTRR